MAGTAAQGNVMTTRKPLAELAIYSLAMPLTIGLCLWILLGPFRIDRYLGLPIPAPKANAAEPATPAPVKAATATVVLFPGDDDRLLTQLQRALAGRGYSVGAGGANENEDTLAALEAFQDSNALPVQPKCDPQCWTALGLPDPR